MRIDFSGSPLRGRPYSEKPMTFCPPEDLNAWAGIIDLIAVETGERAAREHWQAAQFRNLLSHALQHSAFWRQRLGAKRLPANIKLADLPVLTRSALRAQVAAEDSLVKPPNPLPVQKHATSGSSGTPVEFFATKMNITYNHMRYFAQFFIYGLDVSLNMARFRTKPVDDPAGFTVKHEASWSNQQRLLRCGTMKFIQFYRPEIPQLCEELRRSPVGYFVSGPDIVEYLLQEVTPEFFVEIGTRMFIPISATFDAATLQLFADVDLPVAATYSAEEVGPIANECLKAPGHYHVATSNVIVEVDMSAPVDVDGELLGRVLVTHLHSYATPFIRYDIGDLARLAPTCPCGHDGPALSHIYGRSKQLIQFADGRLKPFFIRGSTLVEVAPLKEYRFRQTAPAVLAVEFVADEALPAPVFEALAALIRRHTGEDFEIRLQQVAEIDWANDTKRLGFRNELLT